MCDFGIFHLARVPSRGRSLLRNGLVIPRSIKSHLLAVCEYKSEQNNKDQSERYSELPTLEKVFRQGYCIILPPFQTLSVAVEAREMKKNGWRKSCSIQFFLFFPSHTAAREFSYESWLLGVSNFWLQMQSLIETPLNLSTKGSCFCERWELCQHHVICNMYGVVTALIAIGYCALQPQSAEVEGAERQGDASCHVPIFS